MDPSYTSEKSRMAENPPAYQTDMGYPPAQGVPPAQAGYPTAPGYGAAPYGVQPYPGQATVTVQPAVYVTPATGMNPVPDYLGYSIFTMLCCCFPLGVAALIYSINTRDANLSGNRELAMRNSHTSRLLNNIALGLGIAAFVISLIFIIIVVSSGPTVVSLNKFN